MNRRTRVMRSFINKLIEVFFFILELDGLVLARSNVMKHDHQPANLMACNPISNRDIKIAAFLFLVFEANFRAGRFSRVNEIFSPLLANVFGVKLKGVFAYYRHGLNTQQRLTSS